MVYIYGIGPIFGVVRSSLNPVKGLNEFRERGGGGPEIKRYRLVLDSMGFRWDTWTPFIFGPECNLEQ